MAGHCKRYLIMCRENFRGRLSSKGEGSRQAETIANFPDRYIRRPLHKPGMCQKLERPRPIYSIYTRLYQTNFHDLSCLSSVVKICYEETAKYILVWIFHDKTIHDLARGIIVRVLKWAVILLMNFANKMM